MTVEQTTRGTRVRFGDKPSNGVSDAPAGRTYYRCRRPSAATISRGGRVGRRWCPHHVERNRARDHGQTCGVHIGGRRWRIGCCAARAVVATAAGAELALPGRISRPAAKGGRRWEMDRRRREVRFGMPMTLRLDAEVDASLREIAVEEGLPVAIMVRNWVTAEVRRRKAAQQARQKEETGRERA